MMNPDLKRLNRIIRNFKGKRVLVLGDVMLDRYIWGNVSRISPEAPVPVVEVVRSTSCLGGAGNVASNLESLGAIPLLAGIVGEDEAGEFIKESLKDSRGVYVDKARPTTVKTRIIAHHQQVVRVDQEKKMAVTREAEERILRFISGEEYEGLLISDYNKGIITPYLMKGLFRVIKRKRLPVFVDPKVENFRLYSPVTMVAPNHHETEKIVLHECRTDAQVEEAGKAILSIVRCLYLIIKRGEQGMTVFEKGKKAVHIPTIAREVYDVTGAGDTVISAASLALLSGATAREAAYIANAAAGIVVGKIGTASVTPAELAAALRNEDRKRKSF